MFPGTRSLRIFGIHSDFSERRQKNIRQNRYALPGGIWGGLQIWVETKSLHLNRQTKLLGAEGILDALMVISG